MTEDFLHYIWKFRLFDQIDLKTESGEEIVINKVGAHNNDAGPDFSTAKLKVGNTLWAGNVEIHVKASDWLKHKHHEDKAYDNVILHVVYENDVSIKRHSGEPIPALELRGRIQKKVLDNYLKFSGSKSWVPCANDIKEVNSLYINSMYDKALLERLEQKTSAIKAQLSNTNNDWETAFYHQLASNFGFKVNAAPFELLAKSIPHNILGKHKDSLFQLEALLFGQAGMLDEYMEDRYVLSLQNEYAFLQKKYKLKPLDSHLWKFLRLRPLNFPTIRIAQFARLIHRSSNLFSKIISLTEIDKVKKLLHVEVSEYWKTHYVFGKESKYRTKNLGETSMNTIIINTVVPFLFLYGKQKGDELYVERALFLLETLPPEVNAIVDNWKRLKVPVRNAYDTQAQLQLKNVYCNNKRCLDCTIGSELIKNA